MKIRALDVSEANSYIKRILINDPILKGKSQTLKYIVVEMYICHWKTKIQK